jgi:hypothetical protein
MNKGRTGVELRVDGLDEPFLRSLLVGVLLDLEDDDAGDLLGLLAGALGEPADGDLYCNVSFDDAGKEKHVKWSLRCCSCSRGSRSRRE